MEYDYLHANRLFSNNYYKWHFFYVPLFSLCLSFQQLGDEKIRKLIGVVIPISELSQECLRLTMSRKNYTRNWIDLPR